MNVLGVLPYPELGPWELGPLEIHAFGLITAIGLIVGVVSASYRGARIFDVSEEKIQNLGIWLIAFGWIFSGMFETLTYDPYVLREDPLALFRFWEGISSVGGLLGGGIAYLIWAYRNPGYDTLDFANLAAWTLPICFFFGRLGCTFAFDHPGQEAGEFGLWDRIYEATGGAVPEIFPLAMEFPERFGGGIRHNMGFYEAILWGAILVVFIILSRNPRRKGLYLWLLPLLYAPVRFFMDFLRAHPDAVAFGGDARYWGLTPAQYTAIAFLAAGIFGWYMLKDQPIETWESLEDDSDDAPDDETTTDSEEN